eukprot:1196187-Prorocentrum_minimum.AAC.7
MHVPPSLTSRVWVGVTCGSGLNEGLPANSLVLSEQPWCRAATANPLWNGHRVLLSGPAGSAVPAAVGAASAASKGVTVAITDTWSLVLTCGGDLATVARRDVSTPYSSWTPLPACVNPRKRPHPPASTLHRRAAYLPPAPCSGGGGPPHRLRITPHLWRLNWIPLAAGGGGEHLHWQGAERGPRALRSGREGALRTRGQGGPACPTGANLPRTHCIQEAPAPSVSMRHRFTACPTGANLPRTHCIQEAPVHSL